MIESLIIRAGKVSGLFLVGYSLVQMFIEGVLISESGIEYGVILFGIACSLEAIRNKRMSREANKDN